jgi:hypothetical protein
MFLFKNHENQQIYNRALKVLELYFGAEEEEESQELPPAQVLSGNGFNQYRFGGSGSGFPPAPPSSNSPSGPAQGERYLH